MNKPKIAFIGECMIELSGTAFGSMIQSYGGDTLNAATYLSRISKSDIDTHFISALSNDQISEKMKKVWKNDGVLTDLVMTDPLHSTGLYMIEVDENGERSFSYWRDNSAAKHMMHHPDFGKIIDHLHHFDFIFISGITLAILSDADKVEFVKLLKSLKKNKNTQIIFDSNYRPKLWGSKETVKSTYREILEISDLALITFDDEKEIWDDVDVEQTARRSVKMGVKTVIVKDGENGSYILERNNEQIKHVPTIKVNNVIDTTSAGDSFNAGFLSGYIKGLSLEDCCERANKIAGVVIQHKGAIISSSITDQIKF